MYEYAENTKKSKSRAVANSVAQTKANGSKDSEFTSNRFIVRQEDKWKDRLSKYSVKNQSPIQKKDKNTGSNEDLKSGIENFSGGAFDDVKVHRGSEEASQLNTHSYAQSIDISLGNEQGKYLPHQNWHGVQQKSDGKKINDSTVSQVMQYKREYLNTEKDHMEKAWILVQKFEVSQEIPKEKRLNHTEFVYGITGLTVSELDYGQIDLDNPQHIGILYYNIRKQAEDLAGMDKKDLRTSKELEERSDQISEMRIEKQEEYAKKQKEEWKKRKSSNNENESDTYKIAFLGTGASIAYSIAAMGKTVDHSDSIIIGTKQPWAGERGPGVVAHPMHMITPMRHYIGDSSNEVDDKWARRDQFSDLIRQVLNQSGALQVSGKLSTGAVEKDGNFYKITYETNDQSKEIWADEVIAGIGSGAHAVPRGLKTDEVANKEEQVSERRIMNMDMFTKVSGTLTKDEQGNLGIGGKLDQPITIILSGGNGGIDVAFAALNQGYKVHWIVGSGPKFLPGFLNYAAFLPFLRALRDSNVEEYAGKKVTEQIKELEATQKLEELYQGQDEDTFGKNNQEVSMVAKKFKDANTKFEGVYYGYSGKITKEEKRVTVEVKDKKLTGDIFVFAQGQDSSTFDIFTEEIRQSLIPEYDKNQRFTDDPNTSIGLQSLDKRLKIVGATAFRMAPEIIHRNPLPRAKQLEHMDQIQGKLLDARIAWREARDVVFKQLQQNQLAGAALQIWEEMYTIRECFLDLIKIVRTEQLENKSLKPFNTASRKLRKLVKDFNNKIDEKSGMKSLSGDFDKFLKEATAWVNAQVSMRNVIGTLPPNALINDQLTPIRSQIESSHGFVPSDANQRVNFVTDDRTTLAVYIVSNYPKIADDKMQIEDNKSKLETIINRIINERSKSRDIAVPPNGKKFQETWLELLREGGNKLGQRLQSKL